MMFTKRFLQGFLLVAAVFLYTGCSLEDDDQSYRFVTLEVVEAELPEFFELGETYEINVTYLQTNGCISFDGFDVSTEATTTRRVVAIGTEILDQVCTQAIVPMQASFQFVCVYSETYVFRFYAGENEAGEAQFMEYEVPVHETPMN